MELTLCRRRERSMTRRGLPRVSCGASPAASWFACSDKFVSDCIAENEKIGSSLALFASAASIHLPPM